jgi:hypothetical protein
MKNFLQQWLSVGTNKKTRLIKYLEINSYLYMFLGLWICFYPTFLSSIGLFPEVSGREIGFIQVIGFTLFVIGYFYFFGSRTRKKSFCLATIIDRLILVPIVLGFIVVTDSLEFDFILPFLILDPLLALGALYIWISEE